MAKNFKFFCQSSEILPNLVTLKSKPFRTLRLQNFDLRQKQHRSDIKITFQNLLKF